MSLKLYIGTIVEESLEDNSILNNFNIIRFKMTNDDDSSDRWRLYKVEAAEEELLKLASVIKPEKWYAHFWNDNDMIVVFRDKTFSQKVDDKSTWGPAIEHGLSVGIPEEQLDFIIE